MAQLPPFKIARVRKSVNSMHIHFRTISIILFSLKLEKQGRMVIYDCTRIIIFSTKVEQFFFGKMQQLFFELFKQLFTQLWDKAFEFVWAEPYLTARTFIYKGNLNIFSRLKDGLYLFSRQLPLLNKLPRSLRLFTHRDQNATLTRVVFCRFRISKPVFLTIFDSCEISFAPPPRFNSSGDSTNSYSMQF